MSWLRTTTRLLTLTAVILAAALVAAASPADASSYQTPLMFELTTSPFGAGSEQVCLVRAAEVPPPSNPVPVTTRAICYATSSALPPLSGENYPYRALIPALYHQLGQGERSAGQLTLFTQRCIGVPGAFALNVDLIIPLSKSGGIVSGEYAVLTWDTTAPLDCADGTVTTGPLTFTPLPNDHNEDGPGFDPCTDAQELGSFGGTGGLRDPFNPWDFFDPDASGAITIDDIFDVAGFFGLTSGTTTYDQDILPGGGNGLPDGEERDRGGLVQDADGIDDPDNPWDGPGPNPWNQKPPNGAITIDDVFAVAGQFGHAC